MSWIVALALLQAPVETVEPQDPDRPSFSEADLKGLRELNIFSPKGRSGSGFTRREGPREERRSDPVVVRPKPIQVTGFILDPATKTPRAILEDRNDEKHRTLKEPLFAKPGDSAGGWTVEDVLADQITIVQGETKKTLKVGEAFPEAAAAAAPPGTSPTSSTPAVEAPPAPPLDDAAKNDVLERLKQKNKKKRSDEP